SDSGSCCVHHARRERRCAAGTLRVREYYRRDVGRSVEPAWRCGRSEGRKGDRMGERISYKADGHTTPAYVARATQPGPGVVVIQEYWGLVPHIEHIADRFADEGFIALAPDLYHGEKATSPDQAGKLMMAMRVDEAAQDLAGAIDQIAQQGVTSKK